MGDLVIEWKFKSWSDWVVDKTYRHLPDRSASVPKLESYCRKTPAYTNMVERILREWRKTTGDDELIILDDQNYDLRITYTTTTP